MGTNHWPQPLERNRDSGVEEVKGENLLLPSPSLLPLPYLTSPCPFSFPSAPLLPRHSHFYLCTGRKTIDLCRSICLGLRGRMRTGLPAFPFLSPSCAQCVCRISNSESVNKCIAKLHILKAINSRRPP